MQLNNIIDSFDFRNVILFDHEAIIIHKKGNIDEMLIVELTDFYKQMSKFEIVESEELTVNLKNKSILSRKLDDYYLAVILDNDIENEKSIFNFFLMYNRLKRELL